MPKKTVRKLRVLSIKPKRSLVHAYNEKCFWLFNGPVLSNLEDLCRALGSMTDKQFWHHVTRSKNDFANWVEAILDDKECAKALRKARTRAMARKVVEQALKGYSV